MSQQCCWYCAHGQLQIPRREQSFARMVCTCSAPGHRPPISCCVRDIASRYVESSIGQHCSGCDVRPYGIRAGCRHFRDLPSLHDDQ
jgi:hypothetical protein